MLDEALKGSVLFWLTKSLTSLWPWQCGFCLPCDSRGRKMPRYKYSDTAPCAASFPWAPAWETAFAAPLRNFQGILCHSQQLGFGQRVVLFHEFLPFLNTFLESCSVLVKCGGSTAFQGAPRPGSLGCHHIFHLYTWEQAATGVAGKQILAVQGNLGWRITCSPTFYSC